MSVHLDLLARLNTGVKMRHKPLLQGQSYIIIANISVTGSSQSLGLLCLSSCLETSQFSCSDSYYRQKSSRVSWELKGSEGQVRQRILE